MLPKTRRLNTVNSYKRYASRIHWASPCPAASHAELEGKPVSHLLAMRARRGRRGVGRDLR
jgi:hypothetical protein